MESRHRRGASEGRPAAQHVISAQPRVDVRAKIDGAAASLLGRHIHGEPMMAPSRVSCESPCMLLTNPKSRILMPASLSSIKFEGLTSRWTKPCAAAARSPRAAAMVYPGLAQGKGSAGQQRIQPWPFQVLHHEK